MADLLALSPVVAQETTTTSLVPRVVGEPLPSWVVLAASAALLVVILVAGLLVQRRRDRPADRR